MANINLITYSGSLVTPQCDALMNDAELSNNGMFFGGEVSASSADTLEISHGFGVIYGREFEIMAQSIPVQLATSGTLLGRVYINLDLNNQSQPIDLLYVTGTSLPALVDNPNINQTSGSTQMEIATFTVDTSSVNNVVNTVPTVTRTSELKSGLASLNTRVTNLETDSGWKTIGSYITYRIINNIVYLRVRQSGGDMRRHGYVFGTLPSGVYPVFSFAEANVYGVGRVFINQNHTVTFETSSESETSNYIQATFVYPLG
jgi:hypothetical protein